MSSSLISALCVSVIYWLIMNVAKRTGGNSINRPIFLGFVTGLVLGDMRTGIIMGGMLEAVYMGVHGIGAVTSANVQLATVVSVALTCISGVDMETGCAIAVTIGTITATLRKVVSGITAAIHPVYLRLADEGKYGKFYWIMHLQQWFINEAAITICAFFAIWLGANAVSAILDVIPSWILTGLSVSAGMLVVVGLCLISQAIWNNMTAPFVVFGFCLAKYVGIGTLPIAAIGFVIAFVIFMRDKDINDMRKNRTAVAVGEEDDFYE